MRTGQTRLISAFLANLTSLVGVLGIILGVLGMHVAPHSVLPAAAPADSFYVIAASSPHSSSGQRTMREVYEGTNLHDSVPQTLCADIDSCQEVGHLDAACVPAPSVTVFAAPLPGSSPLQVQLKYLSAPLGATASPFGPCPSLSELSISRT